MAMDFQEYLEYIAKKIKEADKEESLRLILLLRDTCNDVISKYNVKEEPVLDKEQVEQVLAGYWFDVDGDTYTIQCPVCSAIIKNAKKDEHTQYHIMQMDILLYIHLLIKQLQK
jgi:hypothetical protein